MQKERFKIILLGASSCGKTSLLRRILDKPAGQTTNPTIGVDLKKLDIEIDSHVTVLDIWDTAGAERFKSLTRNYMRDTLGAFLVFDLTSRDTFIQLDDYLSDLHEMSPETRAILIGNKCDLTDSREVARDEVLDFARAKELQYFETSARTGEQVKEALTGLVTEIRMRLANRTFPKKVSRAIVEIKTPETKNWTKKCC